MKEIVLLVDFKQDEYDELYSVKDFIEATETFLGFDDGGICDIVVEGKTTNIHLGIYMLNKFSENNFAMTFDELLQYENNTGHKILINWSSK
jgi:hypothetical protein